MPSQSSRAKLGPPPGSRQGALGAITGAALLVGQGLVGFRFFQKINELVKNPGGDAKWEKLGFDSLVFGDKALCMAYGRDAS